MGIGDRFGKQGEAQLQAMMTAKSHGLEIVPVWNKSFREHQIIGTSPGSVRREADEAVKHLGWGNAYYVDADHVNLSTVDPFIDSSDFFTLDVADAIGEKAEAGSIQEFISAHPSLAGTIRMNDTDKPIQITSDFLRHTVEKYLFAVQEAGRIYRTILHGKKGAFITEVSMDETDAPQSPQELLIILAMIHAEGIPAQTIAPKFSGRFNKGVDYIGDPARFAIEFEADLSVIQYAVKSFGLPENLKLSVHSGSDKFALYPVIRKALRKYESGVHLKTAGTTWLEELIGLAEAGEEGLEMAKEIYTTAYGRYDELCSPYASVIDIDKTQLPEPETVRQWEGTRYAGALRHDQKHPDYNMHFRQLLHVGYKVAAEKGGAYLAMLDRYRDIVSRQVTENLLERHIKPLFFE